MQLLWRSEDGGIKWHQTRFKDYIDELKDKQLLGIMRLRETRLPYKHEYYEMFFLILPCCYFAFMLFFVKRLGVFRLIISLSKSALLIFLFFIAMTLFAKLRHLLIRISPERLDIMIRFLMNIATRPIALVIGFVFLSFILPTTIDLFRFKNGKLNPQDNWKILIWEGIAIVFWILLGYKYMRAGILTC